MLNGINGFCPHQISILQDKDELKAFPTMFESVLVVSGEQMFESGHLGFSWNDVFV